MKRLILILFLVCLIAPVVSAETLTGTLGGSEWNSTNWNNTPDYINSAIVGLKASNFELTTGFQSLIAFSQGWKNPTDTNAPPGAQTSVIIRITNATNLDHNGEIIGTGTLGYQKIYNSANPPVEQLGGYIFLTTNTWNTSYYNGTVYLYFDYNRNDLYNLTFGEGTSGNLDPPTGFLKFTAIGATAGCQYTINFVESVYADYTATKPMGLGITGIVTKLSGGQVYSSQAFISNATSNATITSQSLVTPNDFIYNVPAESIRILIKSPKGRYYISPVLFTTGVTPTPTPAPTIQPGYIRSYVNVYDINYNQLHGANIYIKDNEAGTWKNATNTANGISYIDTQPYHTLNIYADYTTHANQYYPAELLGADTGYAGDYHFALTLYPYAAPPGTGNVNLYVSIYDNTFKNPVPNVFVQISFPGNATLGAYTNDGGQQVFTVPNHTVMSVTATKAGWLGDVVTIDSGPGPTYSVAMGIDPAVVSPTITRTPVPGGTIPTTIAPGQNPDGSYQSGYANLQGQAMMNWLASNGMGLVQICFLVTIISLLGMGGGRKR